MKLFDLKQFRKDKKITQNDLTIILNCKQSFISAVESGRRTLPKDKIKILESKFGDISDYITIKNDLTIPGITPVELMKIGANEFTKEIISMMNDHLIAPYNWIEEKDKEIERLNRLVGTLEEKIKNLQK
jgi:predicted transcriptional regulator